jgi:Ca2+-binding RTX toxin-like protein
MRISSHRRAAIRDNTRADCRAQSALSNSEYTPKYLTVATYYYINFDGLQCKVQPKRNHMSFGPFYPVVTYVVAGTAPFTLSGSSLYTYVYGDNAPNYVELMNNYQVHAYLGYGDDVTVATNNGAVHVNPGFGDDVTIADGNGLITMFDPHGSNLFAAYGNGVAYAGFGSGDDTAYAYNNGFVALDMGFGNDSVSVIGNGSAHVSAWGNTDVYAVNNGYTSISLGWGNDTITYVGEAFQYGNIWTGGGDDLYLGFGFADTYVDLGAGNDVAIGGYGRDFIMGGDGDDIILGNVGDDIILGGNGNDVMKGGYGHDFMSGDAGNDTIVFGPGDFVYGGPGNDWFVLDVSQGRMGTAYIGDFNPREDFLDLSRVNPDTIYSTPTGVAVLDENQGVALNVHLGPWDGYLLG